MLRIRAGADRQRRCVPGYVHGGPERAVGTNGVGKRMVRTRKRGGKGDEHCARPLCSRRSSVLSIVAYETNFC
jgi:hypothetical protein